MFVLSFFLHSILFAGSALDSFQCLRSLLIVSFHVFFGLPHPCCPTTSNSVMLLIQPSFLTTCPNQRSRLYRNKVCMLLIPSFLRRESELMWSFKRTLHVHRIIAWSLHCSLSRSLTLGANTHWHTTRQCGYTSCIFAHVWCMKGHVRLILARVPGTCPMQIKVMVMVINININININGNIYHCACLCNSFINKDSP